MNGMNIIHDICLTENKIKNTPRWKFITRNKLNKKLNKLKLDFLNLDVFNASNNIISFLISLGKDMTKNVNGYLWYDDRCILIQIQDNETIFDVNYYPKSNRFEIISDYISFSIYRNTKVSNYINNIWESLEEKIKERYIITYNFKSI